MNAFAKVLVVIVLLLSSGFAISQMMLYSKRDMWREKFEDVQTQLETTDKQLNEAEAARDRYLRERDNIKEDLEEKIGDLEERVAARDVSIKRLEKDKERAQSKVDEKEKTITALRGQVDEKERLIDQKTDTVSGLKDELARYRKDVEDLEAEIVEKKETIDEKDKRIAELSKEKREIAEEMENLQGVLSELADRGVNIPPVEVPIIDAKVVRVDNEVGAVVLNKGEESGIKISFPFIIYRDSDFVARVHVMEVHDQYSLARLDRRLSSEQIKVGDQATTRIQ